MTTRIRKIEVRIVAVIDAFCRQNDITSADIEIGEEQLATKTYSVAVGAIGSVDHAIVFAPEDGWFHDGRLGFHRFKIEPNGRINIRNAEKTLSSRRRREENQQKR